MARKGRRSERQSEAVRDGIESEPLEPLRIIVRELTRPDGTTLTVEVPVYPPFQLKKRVPAKQPRTERVRKAS